MIKIGITGGIGSGKSFVAHLMEKKGIPIYYTDDRAKQLMVSNDVIREKLINLLGKEVYQKNGTLNKKLLADYIFSGTENAALVNAIVHPIVKSDFKQWALQHESAKIVAMECAILYEAGFDDAVDTTTMVYAPLEIRIRRAMQRDQATEQQIRSRINAQMSDEEKCKRADFVIYNDEIHSLPTQIESMIECAKNGKP